ncbi:FadR/GntR family transcriptional regulator [Kutzneria sp. 744]|uniref:FadR/GntR family transcriptional regulator n=1 Tax=Kutzneria sp. (strain 744) TaxID=345341 RepID=UPI0003EEA84E|nr:FCD domain-containing protein [Kutzneria sp. 744]EWM13151.1 GntR-family transcriptional regulator [Kutzneria sp. 744]
MDSVGDALFRPVRTGNAFEETVERLLQAIKLGVVPPGERLPAERDLATRLNVSRVTLREALHALQESGFVESRRGRYGGTFVCTASPRAMPTSVSRVDDIEDALTLRFVLETGATEFAAARELSDEDRSHLRARLDECDRAALDEYRRKDSRLHLAIAELSGSPSLTAAVADVRMCLNELLDGIPLLPKNIEHSNRQHAILVDAILSGDSSAARRAMAEHLDGTASLLRGFLG